jgi:hypothetical protein
MVNVEFEWFGCIFAQIGLQCYIKNADGWIKRIAIIMVERNLPSYRFNLDSEPGPQRKMEKGWGRHRSPHPSSMAFKTNSSLLLIKLHFPCFSIRGLLRRETKEKPFCQSNPCTCFDIHFIICG